MIRWGYLSIWSSAIFASRRILREMSSKLVKRSTLAVAIIVASSLAETGSAQISTSLAEPAKPTVLPSAEIYSEFQRVDPFGNIVPSDRGIRPREILSPAVPRNGHISFHVAVTVPRGETYFLFVAPNPLNACGVEMYRERFIRRGDTWIPDALVELRRLPEFGAMPDPEQNIPGQNTRVYLLDLWIPPNASSIGFRLEVQMKIGIYIIRPLEVRVIPVTIPDLPEAQHAWEGLHSEIESSADQSAYAALSAYVSGRSITSRTEKPTTVRDIIRRDAVQDMILASSLDKKRTGPGPLKTFWKSLPSAPGTEGYLRIRDYIYRQAAINALFR
jgi:hypothetical protein